MTSGTASATFVVTQPGTLSTACTAFATACDWNLTPVVVRPTYADFVTMKFTVPTTGTYTFTSTQRDASADPQVYLYNSSRSLVTSNSDGAGDRNFSLTVSLTAGQVYYLCVRQQSSSNSGSFIVTVTPPNITM